MTTNISKLAFYVGFVVIIMCSVLFTFLGTVCRRRLVGTIPVLPAGGRRTKDIGPPPDLFDVWTAPIVCDITEDEEAGRWGTMKPITVVAFGHSDVTSKKGPNNDITPLSTPRPTIPIPQHTPSTRPAVAESQPNSVRPHRGIVSRIVNHIFALPTLQEPPFTYFHSRQSRNTGSRTAVTDGSHSGPPPLGSAVQVSVLIAMPTPRRLISAAAAGKAVEAGEDVLDEDEALLGPMMLGVADSSWSISPLA